jgi:hypothetical protein
LLAGCARVPTPGGDHRARKIRCHPGLAVHRDRLHPGEIIRIGDVCCTTLLRTASTSPAD